jgi:hypothetical protein
MLLIFSIFLLSFGALLIMLFFSPLEDQDVWLKRASVALLVSTTITGSWALYSGHKLNQIQAREVLRLGRELNDAERKNADAQIALMNRITRNESPRMRYVFPLGEYLPGKPRGNLEIIYVPESEEALNFATALFSMFHIEGGWEVPKFEEIAADDPSQVLPEFTLPPRKYWNLPLLTRVGVGPKGLGVVISPEDLNGGSIKEGTPTQVLLTGLVNNGFEPLLSVDQRLHSGSARIVIGPRQ